MARACDLLIRNAYIVTCDKKGTKIPSGAIAVRGRDIVAVGKSAKLEKDWKAARVIDAEGGLVHPGLIDMHYHTTYHMVGKMIAEADFGGEDPGPWVEKQYLGLIDSLDDDLEYVNASLLGLDMLKSGVTTISDLSISREGWIDDLAATGIRAVVCPMMRQGYWYTKNGHTVEYAWDEKAGEKAFDAAMKPIDAAMKHPSGRVSAMVGPSQIDTCKEGYFKEAHQEAKRRNIPVQFLEQLFAALRRAGVLKSQRGVKGGYSFARQPSDVTVLELVELLDGPVGADAKGVFADAAAAARDVLAKTTVADVIERERREAGSSMYYI